MLFTEIVEQIAPFVNETLINSVTKLIENWPEIIKNCKVSFKKINWSGVSVIFWIGKANFEIN